MPQHPILVTTCYDVLTRALRREVFTPDFRATTVKHIRSWQVERTGFFAEEGFPPRDTAARSSAFHGIEQTHLCLSALAELGATPSYPLRALKLMMGHPTTLQAWLSQAQWWLLWPPPPAPDSKLRDQGDWLGEELLHFGGTLCYAVATGQAEHASIEVLFRWLNGQCDMSTGLWGTQYGCSRERALTGSAAIVRLFWHWGWPSPVKFEPLEALELATGDSPQDLYYREVALGLQISLSDVYRAAKVTERIPQAMHKPLSDVRGSESDTERSPAVTREPTKYRLLGCSAVSCWQMGNVQPESSGIQAVLNRYASASATSR